jgi:hypothetical protein
MLFHSVPHMNSTTEIDGEPGRPFVPEDDEVRVVLEAVPEFVSRYLELVAEADDEPGPDQTFTELAEYVSELARGFERFSPVLQRCFAAIEQVAETSDDAEDLIGWSFLDYVSLEARRAMLPWFGPRTLAILEAVEEPDSYDPELMEAEGE